MSIIDKLLQLDANKISEKPAKAVEIKRLTNLLGDKAVFTCQAIDGRKNGDIQKAGLNFKKGNVSDIDIYEIQVLSVIEGVVEPSLKDKKLLEHFNAITPKELVDKLFLAGEITELYNTINELSGYDKDESKEVNEEIKNS